MDKVVSKLVGLGVPGIVMLSTSGLAGAAAITATLAAIGGPFGMAGGVGILIAAPIILSTISDYGMEAIFAQVVKGLQEKGKSKSEILREINGYPISASLKQHIASLLK